MTDCLWTTFRAPEGVLLCVMPVENGTDDLVHMKHVLIEAHCREHRIPLVKVQRGSIYLKQGCCQCIYLKIESNTSYIISLVRIISEFWQHIIFWYWCTFMYLYVNLCRSIVRTSWNSCYWSRWTLKRNTKMTAILVVWLFRYVLVTNTWCNDWVMIKWCNDRVMQCNKV